MKEHHREENLICYEYRCEGCGCRGLLKVPIDQLRPIACPEGCGASYVQWLAPGGETAENQPHYELMCVVCPVFVQEEDQEL